MEQIPAATPASRRPLVLLVAACAAWLALLYAFRFGFMEIEAEADPCLSDPLGALCRVRAVIGMSIHLQLFGTAALVLALLANLRLGRVRRAVAHRRPVRRAARAGAVQRALRRAGRGDRGDRAGGSRFLARRAPPAVGGPCP